jgi:CheY-like chemotaxis protein
LEGAGFQVAIAYDGWEALDAMRLVQADCVLADVLMPRMNGIQLAIALRRMHPQTRILLFSGQAGIADLLDDGRKLGFEFELIPKPIHPLSLIEHLKRL